MVHEIIMVLIEVLVITTKLPHSMLKLLVTNTSVISRNFLQVLVGTVCKSGSVSCHVAARLSCPVDRTCPLDRGHYRMYYLCNYLEPAHTHVHTHTGKKE